MVAALPDHKPQYTGNATLDRVQSNVGDVYTYLKSLVWLPNYAYAELSSDVTISSTSLVDLLTTTLSTSLPASFLLVTFTVAFDKPASTGTVVFTVSVDGKDVHGPALTVAAAVQSSTSIVCRVPVTAGKHTVKARWLASVGSVRVLAGSSPLNAFATLLAEERP